MTEAEARVRLSRRLHNMPGCWASELLDGGLTVLLARTNASGTVAFMQMLYENAEHMQLFTRKFKHVDTPKLPGCD